MKRQLAIALWACLSVSGLARAQDDEETEDAPAAETDAPVDLRIPPHRYTYAASGVLLLGGLGMTVIAHGEASRAELITSSELARSELRNARTSAATANLLYALAGLTLAYGLVLELLPEPARDTADLTFHF